MKAIDYHGRNNITYEASHPEPMIQHPSEVKIKVDYCGICGSDLHEYLDGPIFFGNQENEISNRISKCMGHEICGEVVEIGSNVTNLKIGDKVVVDATGTCLDRYRFPDSPNFNKKPCAACSDGCYNSCKYIGFTGLGFADGGFAEYCVVGDIHAIPYPESIIPTEVAALTEPLAVSWHAVRTSDINPGESALILGAGPIGLATIFALKGHKVNKIVISEPALARRLLAERFQVEVFNPSDFKTNDEAISGLKKLTIDGNGFNHSYDCTGLPATFEVSVKALRTNGVATNLAIWPPDKPIDFYPMHLTLHEIFITGSMCYTRKDFEEVIEAYKSGLIDPSEVKQLITSIVHLEDGIEKGFKELISHKDKHIKILLSPKDEYRS